MQHFPTTLAGGQEKVHLQSKWNFWGLGMISWLILILMYFWILLWTYLQVNPFCVLISELFSFCSCTLCSCGHYSVVVNFNDLLNVNVQGDNLKWQKNTFEWTNVDFELWNVSFGGTFLLGTLGPVRYQIVLQSRICYVPNLKCFIPC